MKHLAAKLATGLAALAILGFVLSPGSGRPGAPVNGLRLLAAADAYWHELEANGQPVPAVVPLEHLVRKGLLRAEEIQAFTGLDATLSLITDATHPQKVLMRVRFPGGDQVVALADGSVQSLAAPEWTSSSL